MTMASASRLELPHQLYNHIALPRNVPGEEDQNLPRVNTGLLAYMLSSIRKLIHYTAADLQPCMEGLRGVLETSQKFHAHGTISKFTLLKQFRNLSHHDMLVLHITPQNCALLAYQDTSPTGEVSIIFEAFETSATADKVLAAKGALQWDFPGSAVAVSESTFNQSSFQDALATFLEQTSHETVTKFAAITWKAAAKLAEIRDTSDPALISGLLMAIMEANGTIAPVHRLRKRVHDTVNFDNARKPWRRSPFYLVLRVAIQRYLYRHLGAEMGRNMYKAIMCTLHAQLLERVLKKIPLEDAFFLRQKLGRRLAKLSSDLHGSNKASPFAQPCGQRSFEQEFEVILSTTGGHLKQVWRSHKQSRERKVPVLPRYAYGGDYELRLCNSRNVLRRIIDEYSLFSRRQEQTAAELLSSYEQSPTSIKPYMKAVSSHISLSRYHEGSVVPAKLSVGRQSDRTIELSNTIREYVGIICIEGQSYAYQKSQQLLHLMELWVLMDQAAVTCYPLLLDYHPGFEPDILDPVELLTLEEMMRAQEVRRYLAARYRPRKTAHSSTIFDDPADDCFAVRFYDGSDPEGKLSTMRQEIEDKAEESRVEKEAEWKERSAEYEQKTLKLNEKECIYDPVMTQDLRAAGSRHRVPCERHNLEKELRNMKIRIFEHPLPGYEPAAKAVIFELQCPKEFAAYRDATRLILSNLCHQPIGQLDRVSLIREYSQLRPYANDIRCHITLGSYKKAHMESHYSTWGFPIPLEEIIRTCGLKPRYCDTEGACWTSRPAKASLWHHFPVKLEVDSPFSALELNYAAWPTSNEILASQAKCPQGLGQHEFTAFQGLLVGTHSRWIDLLRELGSNNMNFSSQSTWAVVSRLVLQQGPSHDQGSEYPDIHRALLDNDLSTALLKQVHYRLQSIQRNWREPMQMETLITILLKITSLTRSADVREHGMKLLHQARQITDAWRKELQDIITQDRNVLQWAIWASLLCKRTLHTTNELLCIPENLQMYLDASISLHYNLSDDITYMPYSQRNAIVQDVLFAYQNRDLVRSALFAHPKTFIDLLQSVWHVPDDFDCKELELETIPDSWWILLTLRSQDDQYSYFVHFNYLYGTLLIGGKEMGTLPLSYRMHPDFRHILGTRNPVVYPSPLPGMDFALCETMRNRHKVHLAYRNDRLIIRAVRDGRVLEFVPYKVFDSDLPMALIQGCYHWLDVRTGDVEIRQKDQWAVRDTNWWIRRYPRGVYHAVRKFRQPKQTTLVEPTSQLVQSIAEIFRYFEDPSDILVFTRNDGQVTVELKRMDLSFFVDPQGLLVSRRLGAVVSQDQNCGTWYGLRNKIVIQSIVNHRQKSILVPLGDLNVSRDGPHVCVDIGMGGGGEYLKYTVNDTLGRIDCAPEPRLLYTKALLHAYTSHVVADPLTGRTGTEEALSLLQSAAYQPWNPLSNQFIDLLNRIKNLSPQRGYYPPEVKCMETVCWNDDCTTYMQDDRYAAIISRILKRSSDLSHFLLGHQAQEHRNLSSQATHLATRALVRCNALKLKDNGDKEEVYHTRDTRTSSRELLNVLEITKLLLAWQTSHSIEIPLVALLHNAPVVGGYDKLYRRVLLSDHFAVDLRAEWGALAQKALQCNSDDKFSLMFLFSTLAFSSDANLDLLRVLVSFAMLPEIRAIPAPKHPAYFHFRADGAPPVSYFVSLMARARVPFSETGFKKRSQLVKAESLHDPSVDKACELLAASIVAQWPSSTIEPQRLASVDPAYLDIARALEDITPEWIRLTQNHELLLYLERVQGVLSRAHPHNCESVKSTAAQTEILPSAVYPERSRAGDDMSLCHLLKSPIAGYTAVDNAATRVIGSDAGTLTVRSGNIVHGPGHFQSRMNVYQLQKAVFPHDAPFFPMEIGMLREVITKFKDPSSFVQCRYAAELETSICALQESIMNKTETVHRVCHQIAFNEINTAKDTVAAVAEHIRSTLRASDPQARWLQMVDLWPGMTFIDLLSQLRETSGTKFGKGTKEALVALGLATSKLQQLLRIHDARKRGKQQQERDEWANEGHTNWNPLRHPDWLLLEIDGDVLLREEQVDVALATVSPPSDENSVLQLQMGKGKTSCILPMAAALLANGTDLARVVVPRALLLQSAQAMQAKLGSLVNRELMHVPFSRRTPTTKPLIRLYERLHTNLRDRRGILLALPEHILSFKLSGLQQLCDGSLEPASRMMETQRWLDQYSRDVLDECDISLAIRTQLIYPSGTQTTVDGHPTRWQVIQNVLHLVKDFSSTVQTRYPCSIEIVKRGVDGFPLIYFLRKDAEDHLLYLLVKIICKGQVPSILPCAEYSLATLEDIQAYIFVPTVRSHTVSRVCKEFQDKPKLMKTINLLRGLFVHRILLTTLKKRWNVQYGLHSTRAPIAVPYLAKGVPSPTAEWGHPDVAITLTCLSFYYQGLSMHQFKESFEHLAKIDEPSIQYEKWFPRGCIIPRDLGDYAAINSEDVRQLGELHQLIRCSASLIDFYLNNFVFPKYAKTFKLKLQASGWNLFPSVSTRIKQSGPRVTGFSGTNDSRHQLPLLIQQQKISQLAHTNAEVPYYLLMPLNQSYVRMNFSNGTRWTEADLISSLAGMHSHIHNGMFYSNNSYRPRMSEKIRILIDAGAQVLEHSNKDFARAWLDADWDAAAAVYFDDDHRVWVLSRAGKVVPLVASPFADNLDRCVVYLDESHCRGTDLKFPPHARAALTLGQHLTKDALVQAAMRLRLLGKTQSVTFYSPPEVHQGILDRLKVTRDGYHPTSGDVLQWLFGQTCDIMEQSEPSFFAQTSQYLQQEQARLEYPDCLNCAVSRDSFLSKVRAKETLSLKQLYQPKVQRQSDPLKTIQWHPKLGDIAKELRERRKHFQDRGTAVHASALEEVEIEQEREAEREIESEVEHVREVQQSLQFQAAKVRKLHEDVIHFATFGHLVAGSDAYHPIFSQLGRTELGRKYTVNSSMKSGLWVSAQFSRTVEALELNDNYIRSPHWILWSNVSQQALLISPEEANELIPIVQRVQKSEAGSKVHLIVYAAPVTRRMLHFNQLSFYAIPPLPIDFCAPVWLRVELGLFAGRLYLEWDEYHELLGYFGLGEDLSQDPDKTAFATKPLTFLHEWITLRRKGQDFEHTPMGFITTGKPLTENHPFFHSLANGYDPALAPKIARHAPGYVEEQEEDEHDDRDDEEFEPAVEHIDDSEDDSPGFKSCEGESSSDGEDDG